jgi:UDP-N-acetylglucosamine:LPS N-acetylglucosamine transferase
MRLEPWWRENRRAWVTFDTEDAISLLADEADVTWAFSPTTRNIPNLIRNTWQALSVVLRFRPTVMVTTGAAVALPYFVLGRLLGRRTVYIEVFDRIDSPTLSGRLCRPFTDLMLVQWPEQAELYNDAVVVGPLL